MDLKTACREAFAFALNRFVKSGLTYGEFDKAFQEFWARDGERLAMLASRCPSCSGYHQDDEDCDTVRARREQGDAEHARRCRAMAKDMGLFSQLPRYTDHPPLQNIPAQRSTLREVALDAPKSRWVCRGSSCVPKVVEAATAQCCYTCGELMVPA